MQNAGYSGTPLAKKLGIKDGLTIKLVNQPPDYDSFFTDFPPGLQSTASRQVKKDLIHYFTKTAKELTRDLPLLRSELKNTGMLWVSWPKKSSGLNSDVNENLVRQLALQNNLVDVKVCGVSDIWSGLKLVVPLKYRSAT